MTCLFPIVSFCAIPLAEANELLVAWGHKMGPLCRPQFGVSADVCHGLYYGADAVAVTTSSRLISASLGKQLPQMTRDNTLELSRLCACRSGLCRVALRLWREFVFADSGYLYAISYQDADLHNGNTYRFDGWRHVGDSRSGTDMRSGRAGRNKKIWAWSASGEVAAEGLRKP
jgi:hypothetical protein